MGYFLTSETQQKKDHHHCLLLTFSEAGQETQEEYTDLLLRAVLRSSFKKRPNTRGEMKTLKSYKSLDMHIFFQSLIAPYTMQPCFPMATLLSSSCCPLVMKVIQVSLMICVTSEGSHVIQIYIKQLFARKNIYYKFKD